MEPYSIQQHLDLYFSDRARKYLPDPERWPETMAPLQRVVFSEYDQLAPNSKRDYITRGDKVAAEIGNVTVKFNLKRVDEDARKKGAKNEWRVRTVVYSDLQNMEKAYEVMLEQINKKRGPGRPPSNIKPEEPHQQVA